jgi:hypothetical protein
MMTFRGTTESVYIACWIPYQLSIISALIRKYIANFSLD